MPYKNLTELPENVRSQLPLEAQRIYVAAFNCAWEQFLAIEAQQGAEKRQEMAAKTAWSAVSRASYDSD